MIYLFHSYTQATNSRPTAVVSAILKAMAGILARTYFGVTKTQTAVGGLVILHTAVPVNNPTAVVGPPLRGQAHRMLSDLAMAIGIITLFAVHSSRGKQYPMEAKDCRTAVQTEHSSYSMNHAV